jgi:hypothetical protein
MEPVSDAAPCAEETLPDTCCALEPVGERVHARLPLQHCLGLETILVVQGRSSAQPPGDAAKEGINLFRAVPSAGHECSAPATLHLNLFSALLLA